MSNRTKTVHFPPRTELQGMAETSNPAPPDAEPTHPINLFGVLHAEQIRIKQHVSGLPHSGHRLRGDLTILRGSLRRALEACDQLIGGMES